MKRRQPQRQPMMMCPFSGPKMLCIGRGPGPKNVLALMPDGTKTVVPYAIWKHKLSKT